MAKSKKEINRQRHKFLLTFFDKPDKYEVKKVNGFSLVRQWNGNSGRWEVAIYPEDKSRRLLFDEIKH